MTEKEKTSDAHDFDTPWKEVIEHYFQEFIEFFFPKAFQVSQRLFKTGYYQFVKVY